MAKKCLKCNRGFETINVIFCYFGLVENFGPPISMVFWGCPDPRGGAVVNLDLKTNFN